MTWLLYSNHSLNRKQWKKSNNFHSYGQWSIWQGSLSYILALFFFVGFSLHSRLPEIWLQRDPGLKPFIVLKKRIKIMSFPWAVINLARVIVLCSFSWFFSGFSLHSRLLEISDSLSLEEVKKIKFLVKSKVSGFRLARITEAFELFEELETNGVFPCHYIANLLAGIQRYDLVEKLGIQLPLTAAKHGNNENP